jgi:hypothetical protein
MVPMRIGRSRVSPCFRCAVNGCQQAIARLAQRGFGQRAFSQDNLFSRRDSSFRRQAGYNNLS